MEITTFLDNSPSPAWAAASAAQLLMQAGFKETRNIDAFSGQKFFVRPHPGMLIAVRLPEKFAADALAFRIIGAHTDSPHLRLKPNAAKQSEGHTVLTSEIYGGALLYSWFDRELGIAGEVYFKQGNTIEKRLVRSDNPVAVVPSLAIHLQRGVNEDGFAPAKNSSLNALIALAGKNFDFREYLAAQAEIPPAAMLSYDLSLFDLKQAGFAGINNELLLSARLDNLVSCFAALCAISQSAAKNTVQIAALFDHEEIGSVSEAGAESAITQNLLGEVASALELGEKNFRAALGRSVFLSADMAHGVHPNAADKHDTENRPVLGGGVTLKINQNRRYATSGETQALFNDICRTHQIPSQIYTHRNDLPCGSTIGPAVSARLGIPTLDVGLAMLGMHSIRETCAWEDLNHYQKFMATFLAGS